MNFTDEEIRMKVAEAMGWHEEKEPVGSANASAWWHNNDRYPSYLMPVPNYPEDLNACAEFEAKLTDEEKASYVMRLNASHPTSDIFYPDQSERGFNNKLAREVFGLVSATARQRCLAFLKTKGLIP